MKLWCQVPSKLGKEAEPFYNILNKGWDSVKRPDTETVVREIDSGIYTLEQMSHWPLRFINDREILKSMLRAEAEGFDGVVDLCFFDPALKPARQLLSIPVVGSQEASIHLSSLMGARFAIITLDSGYVHQLEETLGIYRMRSQAIEQRPVRALTLPLAAVVNSCLEGNFTPLANNYRQIASECIDDGAEVLISGCGLLAPLVTWGAGLREIDNVPIIDPMLIVIKFAEMLVDLHKKGIRLPSRKGLYLNVPEELLGEIKGELKF